jgi:hypothetical protein
MSNSVSNTRLPLDPKLLGELIEKLPNEVIEQLLILKDNSQAPGMATIS